MAGIFDAFTGNAQSDAQANARSFLQDIRQETAEEIERGLNQGLATLQSGVQPSLDALLSGYNQAQSSITQGSTGALGALQQGTQWGASAVNDLLQPQIGILQPTYGDARNATALARGMQQSALGLTDPAMARSAFRTSPGYEFMLNEGLESIARNANRAGMLASGNQMRESQTYGSGLADKEWDDWMNRLFQQQQLYAPIEANMAGKMADAYGTAGGRLADLYAGYGKGAANVYGEQGKNLATLANNLGTAQAGIFGNLTQQQADFLRALLTLKTQANIGLATGQAQSFVGQGDAEAQASKNIFDTILGAIGIGAKNNLGSSSNVLSGLFK